MDETVQRALDLYEADMDHWGPIYEKARDDLRFLSDAELSQWDEKLAMERTSAGRPCLVMDQLGQFVNQTVNDILMNTPTINVIPSAMSGDEEEAEIRKGLIRNIEYKSNADDAYDMAAQNSVKCSIGFIRVDHDYADNESFDQDLYISRVVNPLACVIDKNSEKADGSDAMHGFVIDTLSKDEWGEKYGKFDLVSFTGNKGRAENDDDVTIAEFFEIEEEEKEIAFIAGQIIPYEGQEFIQAVRKVRQRTVRRYILSGQDVLEETTFPGEYIPLIPVYGQEAWEDGERKLNSLIRKSKGAQRLYNLWKSTEAEVINKMPQAPFKAAEGQIEDYVDEWANPEKAIVMRYKQTDAAGNQAPPPTREQPPVAPAGLIAASQGALADIRSTIGIYGAGVGDVSNLQESGVLYNSRKQEGDVATYHFSDNLMKSIAHVGRVLLCAMPYVYDAPRVLRIIGEEEETKVVGVNGQVVEDQERSFDLRQGKYDVKIVTGAPFTTRRQEAAKFFESIVTSQPQLMQVMGDLLFKYQDFTGAEAMASRMKKVVDPKFLEDEDGVDMEKMQMAQQLQEMQQQMQGLLLQLQDKSAKEQLDREIAMRKVQIEEFKAVNGVRQDNIDNLVDAEKLSIERDKYGLQEAKTTADIMASMQRAQPDETTL